MTHLKRALACAIPVLAFTLPAPAELRLPAVLSDHMVLQQERPARLWGWAAAGEEVRARGSWQDDWTKTTAGSDGRWSLELDTPPAGGPYEITVVGPEEKRIRDVLVGEVWVCSGQSNMEMRLRSFMGVLNADQVVAESDDPLLRCFNLKRAVSTRPRDDCTGSWQPAGPETVESFSAAGYFFARSLRRELDVPVGMIHASWGGTRAEAWTRREALQALGGYEADLARKYVDRDAQNSAEDQAARQKHQERVRRMRDELASDERAFAQTPFDDSGWESIDLPRAWEKAGSPAYDGVAWFRQRVTIPANWARNELVLELGAIDDQDVTFFDGHRVGSIGYETENHYRTPRKYRVAAEHVRGGEVVIAVRVFDGGGDGGLTGPAEAMRLRRASDSTGALDLSGSWRWNKTQRIEPYATKLVHANVASALYNAMIHPILPYRLRGAIWYQGESNHQGGRAYRTLFPAMIRDWRKMWDTGPLPFYYVQIAPFHYRAPDASAFLREAQLMTLGLPDTGMIVITDVSEVKDIHPRDKKSVGERLARWALSETYGKSIVPSGPLYRDARDVDGAMRVRFRYAEGLTARDGALREFEIAGADQQFHPAQATIEGDEIVVSSEAVSEPVAVRFGWSNTPQPNLFNGAGLPASPFRTDDW